MTAAMRYICEKDNPKNIIAYGYTMAAGGLGQFDSAKYTEITGELPQGSVVKPTQSSSTSSTENPSQPTSPTNQQLTDQVAALQAQLAALMAQLGGKGLLGK